MTSLTEVENEEATNCTATGCCTPREPLRRREFIKVLGFGSAVLMGAKLPVMAGPFVADDFARLVPPDKKLDPAWVDSLFARGERTIYRGGELAKIGMPIGGLCTGQLYLGGDGKLWHWDIFNQHIGTGDGHYANPPQPDSPLEQGFALRVEHDGQSEVRALDATGFEDVTFTGEYPIGFVEYRDERLPVAVALQAFSPFIPLNADDSGLPATVLQFTLTNTGAQTATVELSGWLQNAVGLYSGAAGQWTRRNRVAHEPQYTLLECSAEAMEAAEPRRPEILFEDFEKPTYEGWTVTGEAFGAGPAELAKLPGYQGQIGGHGERVVNTHGGAPGDTVETRDVKTGTLTSRAFTIERRYISFLVGGGNHPGQTCVNLLIDGKIVRSVTGHDNNRMRLALMEVREFEGRTAQIQVVDAATGPWGNIGLDDIIFSDQPPASRLEEQADYGTMCLALLEPAGGEGADEDEDYGIAALPAIGVPSGVFAPPSTSKSTSGSTFRSTSSDATRRSDQKLVGALSRRRTLAPGEQATITFVVAWHFPHDRLDGLRESGPRFYATRFANARGVVEYLSQNFASLAAQTRLWHETWYDSTLPRWFLDRTFLNVSILATSTAHRFASRRFYGWEGVGCCPGTCTHVWHYAHGAARVFPALERAAREINDYDISFKPETGMIDFRGEFNHGYATDGQAGCILRAYREHQMTADNAFLQRNWPRIKQSLEYLISQDGNGDGVIENAQPNTLDTTWYGPISWLSSLYLAALRAGEEMAREMNDAAFAARTRAIFESGRRKLVELTWNGEYFIQRPDPAHPDAMKSGNGCEIDQVFGQSWAFQIDLGRILPEAQVKSALRSLWTYNFTPDVGPFRAANKMGRWYAMPGEAGLIMCTWPRGDKQDAQGKAPDWAYGYFNECMNGFEYQVAGHMIWEGMVQEGLAITRAVHDRYHAARRNPWNEVECGDHYARSMASHGVFVAACGYEYHGPRGHLGFAPRLAADDFRAAFTAAAGWGTLAQQRRQNTQRNTVEVKWGALRLSTLALSPPAGTAPRTVTVTRGGRSVAASHAMQDGRLIVTFAAAETLEAGQSIEVAMV